MKYTYVHMPFQDNAQEILKNLLHSNKNLITKTTARAKKQVTLYYSIQ